MDKAKLLASKSPLEPQGEIWEDWAWLTKAELGSRLHRDDYKRSIRKFIIE